MDRTAGWTCYLSALRHSDIDGRLVSEIAQARAAVGVSNATIKRDLVALSSVHESSAQHFL
jgi:hypothetical protein